MPTGRNADKAECRGAECRQLLPDFGRIAEYMSETQLYMAVRPGAHTTFEVLSDQRCRSLVPGEWAASQP